MDYQDQELQLIKPCPYLLPCGICDKNKTDEMLCVQYGVQNIEQKHIDNGDYSCESCMYKDKGEHEEPCKSCCHNYVNHWKSNEIADIER